MNAKLRSDLAAWLRGNSPPIICGAEPMLQVMEDLLKANGLKIVPAGKPKDAPAA
jgi:hypothetical protein